MINAFSTAALKAIADMVDGVDAPIAVIGSARLARKLGETHAVLALGLNEREQRKLPAGVTPTETLSERMAVVIAVEGAAADLTAHVRDGGYLILASRGAAEEASRDALCGGLMQIEQARAGRWTVTRGQVVELP